MITVMNEMALARQEVKNVFQELYIELKEDYGLSQIEARALIGRVEKFNEDMHDERRSNNQILKQVVALGEPAGHSKLNLALAHIAISMFCINSSPLSTINTGLQLCLPNNVILSLYAQEPSS